MSRLLCSIGVAAVLLLQPATAVAAPTPSPGLDGLLLKPPGTGYKEESKATPGILEGPFDAAKYAQVTAAPDAGATARSFARDGFLTGYGRTWFSAGHGHVWVEAVMAFSGAKGAKAWLRQSEAADKADPIYSQALTITGIDTYYGARLVDKVHKVYADAFVFLKGNDVFLVTYVSSKNDLAAITATQTRKQYDAAPPYTIPMSQWPESKVSSSSPFDALKTVGAIIAGVLIVGLIAAAAVILRSRRRPALQAIPTQRSTAIGNPAQASTPAAVATPAPGDLQMSDDRRSWWDGSAWRDAEHEVPPAAQRSEDKHFWWDGTAWRPMPPSPFKG
jgi:hypothetical protein